MAGKLLAATCLCVFSLGVHAQGTTLQNQEEEDSTIAVIGYFCKNDTMEYTHVFGKEKINGSDTTVVSEATERMMIVVTDSTSEGYKMELIPLSCEVESHDSSDFMNRLPQLVWENCKDLRCKFTTDEFGVVQHIENWREIRDVMKKTYKMVFDSLYASMPVIDSLMPRQNIESLLMLRFSTEDGVKEVYEELETLFGLHGSELLIGQHESDGVSETGYPTHNFFDVFYSAKKDEYDFDGDYVVQLRTETKLSAEDTEDLLKSSFDVMFAGGLRDSVAKYTKDIFAGEDGGMTVTSTRQYCYFYNGWPKLMQKVEETNVSGMVKKIEYDMIEWSSRRWGVFTFPEEEEEGKKM